MTSDRTQRRLAAILAADVVGYSRLMGQDEAGTLAALKALRTEVIDPKVAEHSGRIFKSTGDGCLAEFPSVVNAVRCAVAIQQGMKDSTSNSAIQLRIGINVGDVVVEEGDVFGDGVNVAARVESIAPPGGIALTEMARQHLTGKLKLEARDTGTHSLKNIERPVRVFLLEQTQETSPTPSARKAAVPDRPSIAVLPFTNMSSDPEQEYFADGIAEDLITQLSRTRDLLVIARNSTFIFKGRSIRVQDVARELGVRYVLEGSVRRVGKRVRVTAQLIDAETSGHIWADRYDRELTDFFELQDEITKAVTVALQVTLTEGEAARHEAEGTRNLDAWGAFLQGRTAHLKFTKKENQRAQRFFEQALQYDPNYGSALIELAVTHWLDARFGYTTDTANSMELAKSTLRRAEEIIGETGALCSRKGAVALSEMRHEEALNLARRAVRLAPSDAYCAGVLGMAQIYSDELQGAIASLKGSLRLSPFGINWVIYYLAFGYLWLRDFDQARNQAALYLEREPQEPFAYLLSAIVEAATGQIDAARSYVTTLLSNYPEISCSDFAHAQFYRNENRLEQLLSWLKSVGLPEGIRDVPGTPRGSETLPL
jgi:adenylate cyclase